MSVEKLTLKEEKRGLLSGSNLIEKKEINKTTNLKYSINNKHFCSSFRS